MSAVATSTVTARVECAVVPVGRLEDYAADAVVVPLLPGRASVGLVPAAATAFGPRLSELAAQLQLGEPGSVAVVPTAAVGEWRSPLLVLVTVSERLGTGGRLAAIRDAIAIAVRRLAPLEPQQIVLPCDGLDDSDRSASVVARAVVESAVLGSYSYDRYRERTPRASRLTFAGVSADDARLAQVSAAATNVARDLVNTPGLDLVPADLAELSVQECGRYGIPVRVIEEDELAAGGYGGMVAVGKASVHPPRLVVLGELPAGGGGTALVGKGITFDTGGLSLKDALPMLTMKCDMAGAATVLAAYLAAAELGIADGLVGYLACAENSVSGLASRPGDVITHRNGITSEIISTDAEGRLVLGDALALATEARPDRIVDVATLTGATGLGPDIWGVLGNDRTLCRQLIEAGDQAGEPGWELPLWTEYHDSLSSSVATIKNYDPDEKWGHGAVIGALYLREFVGDIPWAHLDTAATAFRPRESPTWAAGATGNPVRALITWLRSLAG